MPRLVFPSLNVTVPMAINPLTPGILTETLRVMDCPTVKDLGVAVNRVFVWRRIGGGVGVTINIASPVTPLKLAVMGESPVARALARPVVEMVATEGVADAQVTWLVRISVELSEKVPVAVNCSLAPMAMLGLAGVTVIDEESVRASSPSASPRRRFH